MLIVVEDEGGEGGGEEDGEDEEAEKEKTEPSPGGEENKIILHSFLKKNRFSLSLSLACNFHCNVYMKSEYVFSSSHANFKSN